MPLAPSAIVLLLASSIAAQQPAKPELARSAAGIAEDLASMDPLKVAWAAYDAHTLGDRSLHGPLQKALHSLANKDGELVPHARLLVLDTLIQAKVKVPPTELLPLLRDDVCANAAFLLLAREAKQNAAELLLVFRRDWDQLTGKNWTRDFDALQQSHLRTVAIGNLLAAELAPGFAAFLLSKTDLDLHVLVVDGDVTFEDTMLLELPAKAEPPADFPPLPRYELMVRGGDEVSMIETIAPGRLTIGCLRTIPHPGDSVSTLNTSCPRVDGLVWLLPLAKLQNAPESRVSHTFANAKAYTEAVLQWRAKLAAFRTALLAGLVTNKALLAEDAKKFAVPLEVHVHDDRMDTKVPLPDIPAPK